MKKTLTLFSILLLPSFLLRPILRLFRHKIGKNAKIGFSIVMTNHIELGNNARIGHFNLIKIDSIVLNNNTLIKHFNIFKGPFLLILKDRARIANQNYLTRAPIGVTYGESLFQLGDNSNITSKHFIDLTKNVVLGSNTVLGGRDSQVWTHGYVHNETGDERFRIDAEVIIGNNVYIGSRCIFNPGVSIANAISIGSGSVLSKDLVDKGMYVGQTLRFKEQDFYEIKQRLTKVEGFSLVEEVYKK